MDWSASSRTIELDGAEFDRIAHLPLRLSGRHIGLGDRQLSLHDTLSCGELGMVPMEALVHVALRYHRLTGLGRTPQIAALLFDATGDPRFLAQYFPSTSGLPERRDGGFMALVGSIVTHRHLAVRLIGEGNRDCTEDLAPSARWIMAGCIAEALWGRQDLLHLLLAHPRRIRLYTNDIALDENSGLASSPYHLGRHSIDLQLIQVYSGYSPTLPGVAPFLRGLGHMLADSQAPTGRLASAPGLLPGLGRWDGKLKCARARALFLGGKRLELLRYERCRGYRARLGEPMPIGDPIMFRDDLEFMAGYFELFFRVPQNFAWQNPLLFEAFSTLLRQDPRQTWPRDCSFYVDQTRAAYAAPRSVPPAGIRTAPSWWPFQR